MRVISIKNLNEYKFNKDKRLIITLDKNKFWGVKLDCDNWVLLLFAWKLFKTKSKNIKKSQRILKLKKFKNEVTLYN